MNFNKAKEFIYKNARPLDFARWQFLFEDGNRENVLSILKMYQNEDGGFGHALEADCWNPDSSPVQTWAATQIIREVDLKEKEHPIILEILRYLENTKYFDGHVWANSIPSNEAYPHAPWWNYTDVNEVNYNPTASLIGFILRYASPKSRLYQTAQRLLQEAYAWFKLHCPLESMHTASCFVELFEDLVECNISGIDLSEFESLLQLQMKHILTADTSVWASEYVCKPSLMIHSCNSRFYEENKELCNFECHFLSETQQEVGTWAVTWDWGCYPEEWHISKNWWKSDIIIKNVKFYLSMR